MLQVNAGRTLAVLAFGGIILGAVAIAGEIWPRLDRVTTVTPLLLMGSLLVLLFSVVLRVGRVVVGLASLAALLPAGLMAPEAVAAAGDLLSGLHPPSGVVRLKVLTANLWSENRNTAAFQRLVRDEVPDVIIVQEVFGRWNGALLKLAPEYKIVAPLPFNGDCNVAILSRLKPLTPASTGRVMNQSQDQSIRLSQLALAGDAGGFDVAGVHASRPPGDGARIDDLSEVAVLAARLGHRGILAGDFNAPPWSKALTALDQSIPLRRQTHMLFSWPASARRFTSWHVWVPPFAPIDHIYAGLDWRLLEAHRGLAIGSDHEPVIATFVLLDSGATAQ